MDKTKEEIQEIIERIEGAIKYHEREVRIAKTDLSYWKSELEKHNE